MSVNCNISKLIPIGCEIRCADNSGAKWLRVIGFLGSQGTRKRRLSGGVGSVAVVTVTSGPAELKSKVRYALIIRQKYPYTRKVGSIRGKVKFEDNAGILLGTNKEVLKSVVKGVIARQVTLKKKYSELNGVYR